MFPFCQVLGVPQLSVYGGVSKQIQLRALRAGVKVMIATPGRLLDFTQGSSAVSLHHCAFAVIDEADRMLSLGFEPQIRAIIDQVLTAPSASRTHTPTQHSCRADVNQRYVAALA